MATQQAIPGAGSDNNSKAESEAMIEQLKSDETPDFLQVNDGSALIGTYTVQGGELVYQSGPKRITGRKAHKYLNVDTQSDSTTLKFVSRPQAAKFA
jgi:hypothetical protein